MFGVRRLAGLALIATCVSALSACGASDEAPAGSPGNPLVNKPDTGPAGGRSARDEAASKPRPGFNALVEQQRNARSGRDATPSAGDRTNPCALVTRVQAEAILGARLLDPFVAPQGPTCVYRNRAGSSFATIAVESLQFSDVQHRLKRSERVTVLTRSAYCGVLGRPMLYVPLPRSRVLSIAAPCDTAVRFARHAVPRLVG